ncbi:hypothetical protein PPERSA_03691 [Pseudocohnilembus persalinus]|uniref:Lipase maturation factor n=1 Tax=Pseudocohnilembus persalinus TaxID=266149 RepID=A0A0V0QG33_PSEPJ|nr:hypothetical protein PPERSA_03691 [Pseudocohnilembus persalinus]|eukprot:KRX01187.1 hypothetical protein PPERSA_03691 [Pseudocohnilembus persalinus]
MIKMAILWFLYLSIVNIGQTWYSFGWESQLLETGFLTIFLSPLFSSSFINKKMLKKTDQSNLSYKLQNETIKIYSILGRWLLFRIMLGAGLIKLRGDSCWWDLTCMKYHYQTQPIPNILSYYLHFLSEFWHKFEVLGNHFVEILAPFMLFFNRKLIMIGGLIQIAFQCTIILSGNLSFLNWLTIAPAIFCFDDKALSPFFSKNTVQIVKQMQLHSNFKKEQPKKFNIIQIFKAFLKFILALIILALIGYKSIPIIENLFFSKNQIMNTSFDQFRLVNTYGAFGSITKQRFEVVIQGTIDREISENTEWKEYEFYCKPGNIYQIPCNISPFHLRIDWLMWFADNFTLILGFQSYHQNPWIFHLSMKLIAGHKQITNTFFKYDPFPQGTELPNTIRALLYEYKFSENQDGNQWYERKFVREYMPPFQLDNPKLKGFYKQLKQFGWKIPTRSPQDWQISKQNENKRYKEKRSKNNGKLEKKEEI